jgi:hypothetical protein
MNADDLIVAWDLVYVLPRGGVTQAVCYGGLPGFSSYEEADKVRSIMVENFKLPFVLEIMPIMIETSAVYTDAQDDDDNDPILDLPPLPGMNN